MAEIAGVLTAAGVILALELPSLRKKNLQKELWVFLGLLMFGTAVNLAEALHIGLPNPIDWLAFVYAPVSRILDQIFH